MRYLILSLFLLAACRTPDGASSLREDDPTIPPPPQAARPLAQWCRDLPRLPEGVQRTVRAILAAARSNDCAQAERNAPNIRTLVLDDCVHSAELAPVATLPRLETLKIRSWNCDDVSALSGLGRLRALNYTANSFGPPLKFDTIAALPQLEELSVDMMDVASLAPLARAEHLTKLTLSSLELEDISALGGLIGLVSLDLTHNDIRDVRPLLSLLNLEELIVTENSIEGSLEALSYLTKLRIFYANYNRIADITPLRNLPNLETLVLANNRVTSIEPLRGLPALKMLSVPRNPLDGPAIVPTLRSLSTLRELIIDGVPAARTVGCPALCGAVHDCSCSVD